ncbi:MAG: Asp-tRNA(Asn)/Glu-tRNA(Gln) amidotransferase subunit GatC [Pseudomonadales bacterium]|nr:Asp-tRNA(Asn)/Glu-tRNA(Gln) amidotransferase subunit GatC [Pseudomonadales bacterium]
MDLIHLARLARLSLDQDELEATKADLENIIDMINSMQKIDTDGVSPMANPLDANQRLRADKVTEKVDRDQFQASAPATEDGYYLVPRVVE